MYVQYIFHSLSHTLSHSLPILTSQPNPAHAYPPSSFPLPLSSFKHLIPDVHTHTHTPLSLSSN